MTTHEFLNETELLDIWGAAPDDAWAVGTAYSDDKEKGSISTAGETMTSDIASQFVTIFSEDFESGILGPAWTNNNTNNGI